MFKSAFLPRSFLVFGLCLPLAVLLGYLLATPFSSRSISFVGLLMISLSIPLLMRWHHPLLILSWNSSLIFFFLPGRPALWTGVACVSVFFYVLNRTLRKQDEMVRVPSVTLPLAFLGFVFVVTVALTGGIGGRILGSELWGARRYFGVFGALIGYFALISQPIPEQRGPLFAQIFFLSGVTAVISDLVYALGPKFYFLFVVFSPEVANLQATSQDTIQRSTGVAWGSWAVFYFMLARYGISGICDLRRPWRLLLMLLIAGFSLLGGYRSSIVILGLVLVTQFFFEGLFRTRFLLIVLMSSILAGSVVVAFVDKMPLSVQRSLSVLPVKVDPSARQDARGTLEWRLLIWRVVVPEIPRYLWIGKGFAYSGTDSYLTSEAMRRGLYPIYEEALISGSYHQGILSLIIPFGIWGTLGFVWFCWAGLKLLYANHRHGAKGLQTVNTFLISYFVAQLIFYLAFYGQFDLDFFRFTGAVGLSVALNRGARKASDTTAEQALTGVI